MPIARRKRNPGSCQAGRKSQHLEVRWYGLVSCPIMEQLGSAMGSSNVNRVRNLRTLFASSSLLQGCKFCNLQKKKVANSVGGIGNHLPISHTAETAQRRRTLHAQHRHAAERSSELSFRAAEAKISTWRTARAD